VQADLDDQNQTLIATPEVEAVLHRGNPSYQEMKASVQSIWIAQVTL